MTKRELVLAQVVAHVAKIGRVDHETIRLYVENRVSKQAWNAAVAAGIRRYVQDHPDQAADERWLIGKNQFT